MGLFDFYGICFDYVDLYIRTVDFNQEMEIDFRPMNGHDAQYLLYLFAYDDVIFNGNNLVASRYLNMQTLKGLFLVFILDFNMECL